MQIISPPKRMPRRRRPAGRGVALLFVLVTVAILTSVAVDFSYNTRVNLELAAQSRDALRARSLAMSAMNFSRLLLKFQKQLDTVSGAATQGIGDIMSKLGGQDPTQLEELARQAGVNLPAGGIQSLLGGLGGAAGGGGGGSPSLSIRLWEVVPIDSNAALSFISAAFPAPDEDAEDKARERQRTASSMPDDQGSPIDASFGEFTGNFGAKITDEDQKINAQRLEYSLGGGALATLAQLHAMIDDPKFDFIFSEEDRNRDVVERKDLILALKDWIDADETQSTLDLTAVPSPFVPGFGDENGPYSRYKRRYKAKNAKLDTVQELHQVWGVDDAFMTAFGDRLTVYPDVNSTLNINTDDPLQMLINIITAAENPNDPALRDPVRLQLIMEQIRLLKRFPFIGLSVGTFARIIEGAGIKVKPVIMANSAQNVFLGDRSSTFRIVATGEVGRVKKTLTAVVRYDDGLGQLLYWHEE